jgi:Zn-dependent protease
LGPFPVRITPWYWLFSLVLCAGPSGGDLAMLFLSMVAFFIALLVHELGHAVAYRIFGRESSITLTHFGGYVAPFENWARTSRPMTPWRDVFVSAAGPGAGFLLGGAILVAVVAAGRGTVVDLLFFAVRIPGEPLPARAALMVIVLLFATFGWGLMNLVPCWPLDGGRIAERLLVMRDRRDGARQAVILAIIAALGMIVWALLRSETYLMILFGLLAAQNYQRLQLRNY